ncbi:kinase-like protein [Zopfia rhizophila CBS 207.26]|uniref:Kinase-like protein n=1 Tax=Zopfia rhizophila CBS 207.26 TaxID=1314779 RepID=A0A6A6DWE4_9PEZI|nr:kinase-like protein [Zopfia rhizophila CBS 207.26]
MDDTTKILTNRLSDFFPDGKESRAPYTDSEIYKLSSLLEYSNPRWSKVPRTYIILRTIGYLSYLDKLIDVGFSDYWLPITKDSFPSCLPPSAWAKFMNAQDLLLTKSMDLERGEKGQHYYVKRDERLPFERKTVLGVGRFSQVDKVVSLISFKEYARKRVRRGSVFGSQLTKDMKHFTTEIEILKRLKHRHIVEFVGSYTDPKYVGLIMSPVAEVDLAAYFTRADTSKYGELRTFFGCLASALKFLHERNVQHKDIKPGHILVHHGNVLFTDFGLSVDFIAATSSRSTTTSEESMTPTWRYYPPEVTQYKRPNMSSDIWSLGVVFLEMIVILKGKTIEYIDEFFTEHGSRRAYVSTNLAALVALVEELQETGSVSDNRAFAWIQPMLQIEPNLRPNAAELVASITATSKEQGRSTVFCGTCCVSLDNDYLIRR